MSIIRYTLKILSHNSAFHVTYLTFLGRDGSISVNKLGEDTAQCLNTQGEWGHIQQQHFGNITGQHTTLDRQAQTYSARLCHQM